MPTRATVTGILQDASLQPIVGGKIVATLQGSDIFESGVRIVTNRVQATTDTSGRWSMELIVNGEGENATSSWAVDIFNEFAVSVHKATALFIATGDPITLGDLEKLSVANKKAATDANASRLVMASTYEEYAALPAAQRRANDFVLVTGV